MKKAIQLLLFFMLCISCSIVPSSRSKDSKEASDLRRPINTSFDLTNSTTLQRPPLRRSTSSPSMAYSSNLLWATNAKEEQAKQIKELRQQIKKQGAAVKALQQQMAEAKNNKEEVCLNGTDGIDYMLPKKGLWTDTIARSIPHAIPTVGVAITVCTALFSPTLRWVFMNRNPHAAQITSNAQKPDASIIDQAKLQAVEADISKIKFGLWALTGCAIGTVIAYSMKSAYKNAKTYQQEYNQGLTIGQRRVKNQTAADKLAREYEGSLVPVIESIDEMIQGDDEYRAKLWIKQNQDCLNEADEHGQTPLYKAAVRNKVKIAKLLLDNGAKNIETKTRWSPLQKIQNLLEIDKKYQQMHTLLGGK